MTRAARTRRARMWPLIAIILAFFAGVAVDGWLRTYGPPLPVSVRPPQNDGPATDRPPVTPATRRTVAPTTGTIPRGNLRVPIDGADVASWVGEFAQRRDGGSRGHEAVDILSPRNTPVHAVTNGTIAKIFESKAGGHTIYQFDADGRLCYYYAHLERYADGLHEGQAVNQGDVIGYVGTSGNAPPNTPHLHFAVYQLDAEKRWWKGTPIDPYLVFSARDRS
jgi:murein DD-endopeptidase MepM/ murein hydrolase activator NlpD